MLRPLAEPGQELDGEQVEEALHEAAHAVLGAAEASGPVMDFNLSHAKAARRRQHGDEAMKLAVEFHLAAHSRTKAFHAAIVVVQPNAHDGADQEIKDLAR